MEKMAEKKEKRRILVAKNKGLKRIKISKKSEAKMDGKELCGRLNKLNVSFAKIKQI